jgi:hypothetical protein
MTANELTKTFNNEHQYELSRVNLEEDVELTILPAISKGIRDCTFGKLTLGTRGRGNTIEILDCEIHELILNAFSVESLTILNCNIRSIKIVQGSINTFHIGNGEFDEEAQFNIADTENQIKTFVIGTDCSISNLRLDGVNFSVFESHGAIGDLSSKSSQLNEIVRIQNANSVQLSKVKGKLFRFGDAKFKGRIGNIIVDDCSVNDILVENCHCESIRIYSGDIGSITLSPTFAQKIEIEGSTVFDADRYPPYRIDEIHINKWRDIQQTHFFLNRLTLKKFIALEAGVFKDAIFNLMTVSEDFVVSDSTFIKCRFNRINLRYCHIHMYNTFMQDCDFVSIKWPEDHRINEAVDSEKQYESLRETYRQLKKVSLGQQDKIHALEFQTNEMRMHYMYLLNKRGKNSRDWGNLFIVGTHKWFSDFGQNIWKPLILLFCFHALWYFLCYIILQLEVYPTFQDIDWEVTADVWNNFFRTLLPTHSDEVIVNNQKSTIAGTLDFVMRVCSGYFIFYFVVVLKV